MSSNYNTCASAPFPDYQLPKLPSGWPVRTARRQPRQWRL